LIDRHLREKKTKHMLSIGDTVSIIGVSTGFLGIILLILLHFMLISRTQRSLFSVLAVLTFPAEEMTETEVMLRRTALALAVAGFAVAATAAAATNML
jgi:hypothetical protein